MKKTETQRSLGGNNLKRGQLKCVHFKKKRQGESHLLIEKLDNEHVEFDKFHV